MVDEEFYIQLTLDSRHRTNTYAQYTCFAPFPIMLNCNYELSVTSLCTNARINIVPRGLCTLTFHRTYEGVTQTVMCTLPSRVYCKAGVFRTWLQNVLQRDESVLAFFDGHASGLEFTYDEAQKRLSARWTPPEHEEGVALSITMSTLLRRKMGFAATQLPITPTNADTLPRVDDDEYMCDMYTAARAIVAAEEPCLTYGCQMLQVCLPNVVVDSYADGAYRPVATPLWPIEFGVDAAEAGMSYTQLLRQRQYAQHNRVCVPVAARSIIEWNVHLTDERACALDWGAGAERDVVSVQLKFQRVTD